jgi:hypothetical protein
VTGRCVEAARASHPPRVPARDGVASLLVLLVAVAVIGASTLVLSDALLLWR